MMDIVLNVEQEFLAHIFTMGKIVILKKKPKKVFLKDLLAKYEAEVLAQYEED